MAELIVVDDERDIAFMVADFLGHKGHAVRMAHDGSGLRGAIAQAPADLIVLDLNMPGDDGFTLTRWLREHHDAGIIMLTAADTTFDTVAALETGADDFMPKPFAPVELEARIEAVLRRRRPNLADGLPTLPKGSLAFGPYVFDPIRRRLTDASGETVSLHGTEIDLIAAFAANPGKVLSRDELLDLAPSRGDDAFDRSIDSRITRLRRRLEADPAKPEIIKTVRGAGYLHPRR